MTHSAAPRVKRKDLTLFDVVNTFLMTLVLIVMVYPLWFILMYSLSDPSRLSGGMIVFPRGFTLEAYRLCFANDDIVNGFLISLARGTLGPASMVLVSSMLAFALTKSELRGIRFMRRFCLFSMYVSGGLLPTYVLINTLRLTNSFWVYILPGMANVFNMMLIRAYIENLPAGLEESALIDGASFITVYARIVLPLIIPVLAAVTLYSCVGHWNAYFDAQLYNFRSPKLYPMQYILYNYMCAYTPTRQEAAQRRVNIPLQNLKMAMTIVATLPILFIYPFLQKYFVSGLLVGAIKA